MKMKRWTAILCAVALLCVLLAGCGGQGKPAEDTAPPAEDNTPAEDTAPAEDTTPAPAEPEDTASDQEAADAAAGEDASVLEDGEYTARFNTDSSMFHVNEACDGRGVLTVKDGKMTLHVSLVSKSIVNLFVGTAEDAQKEGAVLLQPTTDTVTYSDGTSDEVYGFDIPVEKLDSDFALALIGTKGKWYDHTVSVTDPVKN